jgi:hypothetical protein
MKQLATAKNSVTPDQYMRLLPGMYKAKKPLFLAGPPGIGKSAMPRQYAIAEKFDPWEGEPICDIRLMLHNPSDLNFPIVKAKEEMVKWVNSLMPSKRLHKDWRGIIMLDEFTQCPNMLQTVALQIMHERRCGSDQLPDGAWVIAAGNRPKDGTQAHKLISSAANRMIMLELQVDSHPEGAWHRWALKNEVHPLIRYYLAKMPQALMKFNPDDPCPSQPTPRSWGELANAILHEAPRDLWFPMLVGAIGEAEAIQFLVFIEIHDKVPDPLEVLRQAATFVAPRDLGILYATCASLAGVAKSVENGILGAYGTVAMKLPKEFGVMLMKDLIQARGEIFQPKQMPKPITEWMLKNKDVLLF